MSARSSHSFRPQQQTRGVETTLASLMRMTVADTGSGTTSSPAGETMLSNSVENLAQTRMNTDDLGAARPGLRIVDDYS